MDFTQFTTQNPRLSDTTRHATYIFELISFENSFFQEKITVIPTGDHTTMVGYSGETRPVAISEERYQTYIQIGQQQFYYDVVDTLEAAGWKSLKQETGEVLWKRECK